MPDQKSLKFDLINRYHGYFDMVPISSEMQSTQKDIMLNLIVDMITQGTNHDELERVVRHSMVIMDAEKHNLDYKKSAKDHGIAQLQIKYQGVSND